MDKLYLSMFRLLVRNRFPAAYPRPHLRGIVGTLARLPALTCRPSWWDQGNTLRSEGQIPRGLLLGLTEVAGVCLLGQAREGISNAIEVWMSTWTRTTAEGISGASNV